MAQGDTQEQIEAARRQKEEEARRRATLINPSIADRVKWAKRMEAGQDREKYMTPGLGGKGYLKESRREAAFAGISTQAKAWKDNRWFRQAFEEAWKGDTSLRGAYMADAIIPAGNTGGEGGHEIPAKWGGYGGLNERERNKWAHKIAARANVIFTEYQDVLEQRRTEQQMESKSRAMGGKGRGSILTSTQGAKGEGEVEKKTLVGRG